MLGINWTTTYLGQGGEKTAAAGMPSEDDE
jgi:hypothetical protein